MKQKTVFACQECGAQSSKWLGRCPDCGAWNSLVEERPTPEVAGAGGEKRYALASSSSAQLYADIDTITAERLSAPDQLWLLEQAAWRDHVRHRAQLLDDAICRKLSIAQL